LSLDCCFMQSKRIVKIILQAVFVVLVFFFLGRSLIDNWQRLDLDFSNLNYFYLTLSLTFFALAWALAALAWGYITKKLKKPLKSKEALKLWVFSQAARYIPGSVWQVVGRVYLGEKKGLSKGETLASVAIETSNLIISSLVVFALSLPFWPKLSGLQNYYPYFAAGFLVFGFLHPTVFNFTTGFFIQRLDKKEKPHPYLFKEIIQMLLPYLLVWLAFGTGFFLLILSFQGFEVAYFPVVTGIFALSWVVGFLFVIAPGGLGARELALVYFLGLFLSHPLAILLAISSRILMIVAELLILLVSAFF